MAAGMEILLADPRGFCAGVDRAIDIVVRALELHGAPIYVRHEIVHNRFVVESLRKQGAIFIDELDEAPAGAIVVFSAHGVSKAVREEAQARGLKVFDATCPLVTKVHVEVSKMHAEGREIIMIGHKGHPEVEGTLGQAKGHMYLVETPGTLKIWWWKIPITWRLSPRPRCLLMMLRWFPRLCASAFPILWLPRKRIFAMQRKTVRMPSK